MASEEAVEPSAAEWDQLKDCDSTLFGFVDLTSAAEAPRRLLITKAVTWLEWRLGEQSHSQTVSEAVYNKYFLLLGHFNLLLLDFPKAMSAYQHYYKRLPECWNDMKVLYGLAAVYFHFNQLLWAVKALQHLTEVAPHFVRIKDVYLRLGIIYKMMGQYQKSLEVLKLSVQDTAATDPPACCLSRAEIHFHIGHLFELQKHPLKAREWYESILADPSQTLTPKLKGALLRQLGWLFHTSDAVPMAPHEKQQLAMSFLNDAVKVDQLNGQGWYFLGRWFASMGQVQQAFMYYRNSIDRSEANADTWCSIGLLYQHQGQAMDALQAYVCAIQLDSEHRAAWTNLAGLYEQHKQLKDALKCYTEMVECKSEVPLSPQLRDRYALIEDTVAKIPADVMDAQSATLPTLEKAWELPIPSELASRQSGTNITQNRPVHGPPNLPGGPSPGSSQINFVLVSKQMQTTAAQQIEKQRKKGKKREDWSPDATAALLESQAAFSRVSEVKSEQVSSTSEDRTQPNAARPNTSRDAEQTPPSDEVLTVVPNLAPLTLDLSAEKIFEICASQPYEEHLATFLTGDMPRAAPDPTPALTKDQLNPITPVVSVDNRKDAMCDELRDYCYSHPAVVIHGLAASLKLDLSLFSTKTLTSLYPEHSVEVRLQLPQCSEENRDPATGKAVWLCESSSSVTSISKYAAYQASSFLHAQREELDRVKAARQGGEELPVCKNIVKFGTNVDLSDESKWQTQLAELNRLPPFIRLFSASNMLSHLGYNVLGMNTPQLYMKVPGNRTPGHQENLNCCSVNLNIGPGQCEWFCVAEEYWGTMARMTEENGVDFLSGSWWPLLEHMYARGVPVYRFVQKPGDIVWINHGTIHWVQALGWCNNVAWNCAPFTREQYDSSMTRYEYSKTSSFRSLIPMVHLSWQLARNVRISNLELFKVVKTTLMRSLRQYAVVEKFAQQHNKKIKTYGYTEGDPAHHCVSCEVEVFALLFVRRCDGKNVVFCAHCAARIEPTLHGVSVLQQFKREELSTLYNSFQPKLL